MSNQTGKLLKWVAPLRVSLTPVEKTLLSQTFAFFNSNDDCWDHSTGDGCGHDVVGPRTVAEMATVESARPPAAAPPIVVPRAW
jgi:hypothetical protein